MSKIATTNRDLKQKSVESLMEIESGLNHFIKYLIEDEDLYEHGFLLGNKLLGSLVSTLQRRRNEASYLIARSKLAN